MSAIASSLLPFAGVVLTACALPSSEAATVARVVDGDTIITTTGLDVRYLLIDAPETTHGRTDCYGAHATRLNADLVLGKTIELTYDATRTDAYGRALAFVSIDGIDVDALLVARGAACVLYLPPDGADRRAAYDALQADAKLHRRGLWGACDPLPPAC